jgi:hypothetical protein
MTLEIRGATKCQLTRPQEVRAVVVVVCHYVPGAWHHWSAGRILVLAGQLRSASHVLACPKVALLLSHNSPTNLRSWFLPSYLVRSIQTAFARMSLVRWDERGLSTDTQTVTN